jgi:hypothetical protein
LRLGVSETHVDALCGKVPKSVLARHYADFSPENKIKMVGLPGFEPGSVKIA